MKRGFLNNNTSTSTAQQLEQDIDDIIEFASPHVLKTLSTKEAEKVDNQVFNYVCRFLDTHKSVINKFGTIPLSVKSDIEKSLSADFGMFSHFFENIAENGGFICPPFLHLLHCFSMEVVVAYVLGERKRSHKDKHPQKEVSIKDLKNDTNNANTDIVTNMEIEIVKEDQSPNVHKVVNTDEDFEPVMSKSKRKREKRKQKLSKKEQGNLSSPNSTILEKQPSNLSSALKSRAHTSSKSSSPTSAKTILTETKNKPTKAAKKDV
jgi:hypothetical protein